MDLVSDRRANAGFQPIFSLAGMQVRSGLARRCRRPFLRGMAMPTPALTDPGTNRDDTVFQSKPIAF